VFYGNDQLSHLDSPAYEYGPRVSLLDPLRPFQWAGYSSRLIPLPGTRNLPLAAYARNEDRVQLPAGSWLLGLSGSSAQTAGFRFHIFDVGANDYVISEGEESNRTGAQDNVDADTVIGHILAEPYPLVAPYILQVRIVNSSAFSNDCQLLLHFAVPRGGH